MSESLWNQPVLRFHEQIAASTPTPGGGAVAAVTATFAAALLRMVCGISLRKTAETKHQQIEAILSRVLICESALARYADEDILAFDAYIEARKGDSAVSQALLLDCARVPIAGAEMVTELQSFLPDIEAVCPTFLSSDLATAMYLLRASRESLLANVKTNLDSLGDGADALKLREKYNRLIAQGPPGAVP